MIFKFQSSEQRRGLSLIEMLVVVAIIGLLLAILLPAIQTVRDAALLVGGKSNLRQLTLATSNYADTYNGFLPRLMPATDASNLGDSSQGNNCASAHVALLPFVEQGIIFDYMRPTTPWSTPTPPSGAWRVTVFINPLDPTVSGAKPLTGQKPSFASFAFNAYAIEPRTTIGAGFPDGTSNTILFGEHYAADCNGKIFDFATSVPPVDTIINGRRLIIDNPRPAAFAHGGPEIEEGLNWNDYYPMTTATIPPVTTASIDIAFQHRPSKADCDHHLPQSSSRSGLLVGMVDGSVRVISPGVKPSVFWSAVTRDRGEVQFLE